MILQPSLPLSILNAIKCFQKMLTTRNTYIHFHKRYLLRRKYVYVDTYVRTFRKDTHTLEIKNE